LPVLILGYLLIDEISQLFRQFCHEHSSRRNAIAVKWIIRKFFSFCGSLLSRILCIFRRAKSPPALLIHFRSRRDTFQLKRGFKWRGTINRHEEQFFRLDFAVKMLDVVEYGKEHLLFRYFVARTLVIFVCTW
jgi:hypothetical protein